MFLSRQLPPEQPLAPPLFFQRFPISNIFPVVPPVLLNRAIPPAPFPFPAVVPLMITNGNDAQTSSIHLSITQNESGLSSSLFSKQCIHSVYKVFLKLWVFCMTQQTLLGITKKATSVAFIHAVVGIYKAATLGSIVRERKRCCPFEMHHWFLIFRKGRRYILYS